MNLTLLQHSLFLGSLGSAILHSIWQSFILWILYETIVISFKNSSAKIKHNLSVFFVFCSFAWFVSTFISKLFITEKNTAPLLGNHLAITTSAASSSVDEFLVYAGNILPYLSITYIFLLLFLMVKLYAAYRYVYFISNKNLVSVPLHLETFASKVATQIKIPQKIKIWISNHIEAPATIGFLKPMILIPLASINHLSVSQLEAIILHELSHIKRNDYLVNLLISIIETILFFNPFMVLFVKIIKKERENCCDDFVLQYQYDSHSYASALLELGKTRTNNIRLALMAVSGNKQLLSRIKRITGVATPCQFNYGQKILALLITTGIFCSLAYFLPYSFTKVTTKPTSIQKQPIVLEARRTDNNSTGKKNIEDSIAKTEEVSATNKNQINSGEKANFDFYEKEETTSQKNTGIEKTKYKRPAELLLNKNNSNFFSFKNVPHIPNLNLTVRIDYDQINDALQLAYKEINKINWQKVENDINKSLADIKLDQLSDKEQLAIKIALKAIPTLKIGKQQFDALKMAQQLNIQKMMQDSLKVAL